MKYCLLALGMMMSFMSDAQKPITHYIEGNNTMPQDLSNKQLPEGFEQQAGIALSFYPELKNTRIRFKLKETFIPLAARPTLGSLLFKGKSKRQYQVIISNKSVATLNHILLAELNFNAQIGVLGHELAHTAHYTQLSRWDIICIGFRYSFKRFRNRFEYENDQRCIDHALGYQLLAWSKEVREKLNKENWGGALDNKKNNEEGYMNPRTIEKKLKRHPLYEH